METRTCILALASITLLLWTGAVRAQEVPQPLAGSCCGCMGQIRFGPGLDRLKISARVIPTSSAVIDPVLTGMTIDLSNANGTVFSATIPSGEFDDVNGGRKFVYENRAAFFTGGVASVFLRQQHDELGGYRLRIKAFGDLSSATLAEMTTDVAIGTSSFFNVGVWDELNTGWRERFPG